MLDLELNFHHHYLAVDLLVVNYLFHLIDLLNLLLQHFLHLLLQKYLKILLNLHLLHLLI